MLISTNGHAARVKNDRMSVTLGIASRDWGRGCGCLGRWRKDVGSGVGAQSADYAVAAEAVVGADSAVGGNADGVLWGLCAGRRGGGGGHASEGSRYEEEVGMLF